MSSNFQLNIDVIGFEYSVQADTTHFENHLNFSLSMFGKVGVKGRGQLVGRFFGLI